MLRSAGELASLHTGGRVASPRPPGSAGLGPPSWRGRHWPGWLAACLMAFFVFGMPAAMILASAVVGLVFAVFRVVWLIVAAVFLYDITVTTGQFEIMKASVASLSARSPAPGSPRGLLVRGVHRGGSRIRSACRHLGGLSGGAGVPALSGSLALLDRQHGPGGLGGNRHSAADPERGHRAGCRGAERHLADGSSPCSRS